MIGMFPILVFIGMYNSFIVLQKKTNFYLIKIKFEAIIDSKFEILLLFK